MSSRASRPRPRPASTRSRRQRIAAGAVLATTSLLGTYLAAIRPQPTYAAPNTGTEQGQGLMGTANVSANALTLPTCADAAPQDVVTDDTELRAAILRSDDDSVICIDGTITLLSNLPTLDDTSVTFVGDDSTTDIIDGNADQFIGFRLYSNISGEDDTLAISNLGIQDTLYAVKMDGYYQDDDAFLSSNSSFTSNGTGSIPTVYVYDVAQVLVSQSQFIDNHADRALAIDLDNPYAYPTIRVENSLFDGNYGGGEGGALHIDGRYSNSTLYTTATIDNCTFVDNKTDSTAKFGGAVFAREASLTVSESQFTANRAYDTTANYYGGGAIAAISSQLFVTDSIFVRNYAEMNGGAILTYDQAPLPPSLGTTTITASYFSGNYTDSGEGGAIYNDFNDVSIVNSTFQGNNTDGGDGGAVYSDHGAVMIANSTFTANEALGNGGALKNDDNAEFTTIRNSTFVHNKALTGADGGAVDTEKLDVAFSYFYDNSSTNYGGAIWVGKHADITSSTFVGNDAVLTGGAVYVDGDSGTTTVIRGSSFIENGDDTAPQKGGGLYFWDNGALDIANSTFIGNTAEQGGGIYIAVNNDYDDTISFTTIANNTATGGSTPPSSGGGIFADDTITLLNSIVSGNTATLFFDARLNPNYGNIQNNVFASAGTTNNAGTAPTFGAPLLGTVGNNGGPLVGDDSAYYLPTAIPAWNSPAVGLADPSLTPSITTTQIGTARAGNVAGAMNASAAPPTPPPAYPPSAPLNVTGTGGDASATITWTAPASAGSFPITDYQAVLSPGGATCLVQAPALSCTITGLTNGTEYTATARALNGAGWGPYSAPSDPFTPEASATKTIVITGTRAEVRGKPGVIVDGTTTGLVAATVQARVKLAGEIVYRDGTTRIVQPDGSFQWQRRSNKKVYVYFVTDDGDVRSNRVIIAPR